MESLPSLKQATLGLVVVLFFCLFKLPYGFYVIIRLATAIIMCCWAFRFFVRNKLTLAIISGSVVLLFQPVFPIRLDRFTWNLVDVLLAVFLLFIVFKLDTRHENMN